MAAKKGNKYTQKFRTPSERAKAYKAFCDHISAGMSAKSFHDPCVENTILKMLKDYPNELDGDLLSQAKAKSCAVWEKIGMAGVSGKLPGFSAGAWIFNMKNRLGWKDKTEIGFDKEQPLVFRMNLGKSLKQEKGD